MKTGDRLLQIRFENGDWDLLKVETEVHDRFKFAKTLSTEVMSGCGLKEPRYEGSVAETGNGLKIEIGKQYLELNYSEAHALLLLLLESGIMDFEIKSFAIEEES